MPSPFPGMDPYLEAHWRDVHARLIIYASDALQGVLPGSVRARVEERVLLETPRGIGDHPLFPDVRVVWLRPFIVLAPESVDSTQPPSLDGLAGEESRQGVGQLRSRGVAIGRFLL